MDCAADGREAWS